MEPEEVPTRGVRYKDILPMELLNKHPVAIIGCGAVGAPLARMLVSMGVSNVMLVDPDDVSLENLGTQGWMPSQIGLPKVDALAAELRAINPDVAVRTMRDRWSVEVEVPCVAFLCVDRIDTRQQIMEYWFETPHLAGKVLFVGDGRMLLETIRTLYVAGPRDYEHWKETLFDPRDTEPGRCTARTTLYAAVQAASWLVTTYTHWLRRLPIPQEININLLGKDVEVIRE